MDKILEHTLLFDFYGELLTDKQKNIYERYYHDDLSLAEISDEVGISRQGVHDALKKCDKQLHKFEDKLGLVERFIELGDLADQIDAISQEMGKLAQGDLLMKILGLQQLAANLKERL